MAKKRKGRSATFMRSINPHLKHKSHKRGTTHRMAKRRGSKKSSSYGLMGKLLAAGVYGGVREKISNSPFMQNLSSKVPLASISDEVVMGGSAYLLKKFAGKKAPMLNPICDAAMIIEASRIGSAAASGQLGF